MISSTGFLYFVFDPKEIEEIPEVLAEISTRLADAGINILEFLSCWRDTIMVIARKGLEKAIEVLDMVGFHTYLLLFSLQAPDNRGFSPPSF